MSLAHETVASLRRRLAKKEIKSRDIVTDLLKEIDAREKTIHAYTHIDRETALKAADEADLSRPLAEFPSPSRTTSMRTAIPAPAPPKF